MSLQSYQAFTPSQVKVLNDDFFWTDTREKISLITEDATLILFYDASDASSQLQTLFLTTAIRVGRNPIFAAVDLNMCPKLAANLNFLRINPDHPLSWVGTSFTPFILVYRNTYPQAFYNGEYSVEALTKYALTLAGQPGYYEKTFDRDITSPLEVVSSESTEENSSESSGENQPPTGLPTPAPLPPKAQPTPGPTQNQPQVTRTSNKTARSQR